MHLQLRNFVYFLFLMTYSALHSQQNYKEYHSLINKAQIASGDSSIIYYEKAIKTATPFAEHLKSLSFRYYEKGDTAKAKKTFLQAIENGYQFENDDNFKDHPFAIEYKSGFIDINSTTPYGSFAASLLKKEAPKMRASRKAYLKQANTVDNLTYEVLLQNENFFQEMRSLFWDNKVKDTIALKNISTYGSTPNSYLMLDLLKKDKFPQRRKCARFNNKTISMILNHGVACFLNKEDAHEFVEMLWKLVEKGDLTPLEYACAYDHYIACYIDSSKSQFGTPMVLVDQNMTYVDVLKPDEVNDLRKKHWLNSLEIYSEEYGISLPKNYTSRQ